LNVNLNFCICTVFLKESFYAETRTNFRFGALGLEVYHVIKDQRWNHTTIKVDPLIQEPYTDIHGENIYLALLSIRLPHTIDAC
jgi:hypothetical protein